MLLNKGTTKEQRCKLQRINISYENCDYFYHSAAFFDNCNAVSKEYLKTKRAGTCKMKLIIAYFMTCAEVR